MLTKNKHQQQKTTTKERQAVYFYPQKQYFKVDGVAKHQLGEPVLLFVEKTIGDAKIFFEKLNNEFKDLAHLSKNKNKITLDKITTLIKECNLYTIPLIASNYVH